jgi:hypothetical protein
VLVIAGVVWHVMKTGGRIDWRGLEVSWTWVALSAFFYLWGMSLGGAYFHLVVRDLGGSPPLERTLAAFWASQLGKYVPGKAWVVVVRVGLLAKSGTRPLVSALASFYETPMMMAVGSGVAVVGIAAFSGGRLNQPELLILIAAALATVLGIALSPAVFGRIAYGVTRPFRDRTAQLPMVSRRTALLGIPVELAAWALMGASAVACAQALPGGLVPPGDWGLLAAATAFAVAAGFVAVVMPGGLGVREWVIMAVLAPILGSERAVVSALLLRLIWVGVEVVAAVGGYGLVAAWQRVRRATSSSPS